MAFYLLILLLLSFSINVKFTSAAFSADEVYIMLSAKIDMMQNEMSMLRRIVVSTKTELITAQTEIERMKAQHELVKRENETTTPTVIPATGTTLSIKSEDMNCCDIVTNTIRRMKAHQKQTKDDLENVINHKYHAMKKEMTNKTKAFLSMENKIDQQVVDYVASRNITDKKLIMMEQETKALMKNMTSNNMEMTERKKEVTKLNTDVNVLSKELNSLTQQMRKEMKDAKKEMSNELTEKFFNLSKKHETLAETVTNQKSHVKSLIKSEISQIEHCQSGNFIKSKPLPYTHTIVFKKPFKNKPAFTLGSSMFDFFAWTNLRVQYRIDEVSVRHAKVHIHIWAGTVAYAAGFSWMACPT